MSRKIAPLMIYAIILFLLMGLSSAFCADPSADFRMKSTERESASAIPKGRTFSGKETGKAPWGGSYSAGAKVTVQLDTKMGPEILIENELAGESVCRLTYRKGAEESGPDRIALTGINDTAKPFLGFTGVQSVTLEVDTGRVFFIVEQTGDMFSKSGYAEDRYLKTTEQYATVGKGFLVDSSHNLLIRLTADSKLTNGARGYFRLFRGSYTDTIDSIPFNLRDGESETWEYPAARGIASWEITLLNGGIRISYRQPGKL